MIINVTLGNTVSNVILCLRLFSFNIYCNETMMLIGHPTKSATYVFQSPLVGWLVGWLVTRNVQQDSSYKKIVSYRVTMVYWFLLTFIVMRRMKLCQNISGHFVFSGHLGDEVHG